MILRPLSLFAIASLALGLLSSASAQVLPPLAYFDFEESSGATTATDDTGNGYDGAVNNAVTFGVAGAPSGSTPTGAANFSGGTAFLNLAGFNSHGLLRDSPIAGAGSYTTAAWLRPDAAGIVGDRFFFGQTTQGIHNGIQGGVLRHAHWGNDYSGGGALTAGDWIHAVFTWDAITTTGRIYLNGSQVGTKTDQGAPNGSGNIIIGARNGGAQGFSGDADDVAIWDKVLTPTEITALSTGTSPLSGVVDSDSDNLPDGYEMHYASNLTSLDATLGTEDFDMDGLTDLSEFTTHKTNPTLTDTDGDTLSDGDEIAGTTNGVASSPFLVDTDKDGLNDNVETNTGTFVNAGNTGSNPTLADTDGDFTNDGAEVSAGYNPNLRSSAPPIPAPLMYWDFEGDSGVTATDKSGNANNGTTDAVKTAVTLGAGGAPYGSSETTGAIFSVGGDGFMNVPTIDAVDQLRNVAAGDALRSYTMTAWVKPTAAGISGDRYIFGQQVQGIHNGLVGGKLRHAHWGSDNSGSTSFQADQWVHVAWVYDGVANSGQMFYNGRPDSPVTGKNAPNQTTSGNKLIIGGRNGGTQNYQGGLDEIAIWQTKLTALDIARLAAGASPINAAGQDTDDDDLYDAGERKFTPNLGDLTATPEIGAPASGAGSGDFDGDGISDFEEILFTGTNPMLADTDNDGLIDPYENNSGVYVSATNTGTDPNKDDTDNDGLKDGVETNNGTMSYVNPTNTGSNPLIADTDSDTVEDGLEVQLGSDPTDASSLPTIPAPLVYFDFEDSQDCVISDPGGTSMRGYKKNTFALVSGGATNGPSPGNAGEFSVGGNGFLNVIGFDMNSMLRDVPAVNQGSYTMSCWLKPNSDTVKDTMGGTAVGGEAFIFGQTNQGVHNGVRSNTTVGTPQQNVLNSAHWASDWLATTPLVVDEWVHAVWTYDGETDQATIYLNGVQDGTSAQNPPNGGGNLIIGARNNGDAPYHGLLDDVAVWNLVLPQVFISDLASNTRSPIEKYDTDSEPDGLPDIYEVNVAGNLTTLNGDGVADFDMDGLSDLVEYTTTRTDPTLDDTDGDGMKDGVETNTGVYISASNTGTNPLLGLLDQWVCDGALTTDDDSDNLDNILEFAFGTNPFVSDNSPLATTGAANVLPGGPVLHEVANTVDPFFARFVRRQSYIADKLTYSVQFSSDLITWETTAAVPAVIASENGLDVVEVPYTYFLTTGRKASYFRINVTYAP